MQNPAEGPGRPKVARGLLVQVLDMPQGGSRGSGGCTSVGSGFRVSGASRSLHMGDEVCRLGVETFDKESQIVEGGGGAGQEREREIGL